MAWSKGHFSFHTYILFILHNLFKKFPLNYLDTFVANRFTKNMSLSSIPLICEFILLTVLPLCLPFLYPNIALLFIFALCWILNWFLNFFHLYKIFVPLSSSLCKFWWEICGHSNCRSLYIFLGNFSPSLFFSHLIMTYLGFLFLYLIYLWFIKFLKPINIHFT